MRGRGGGPALLRARGGMGMRPFFAGFLRRRVFTRPVVCIAGASMEDLLTKAGNGAAAVSWPKSSQRSGELMTLKSEDAPPLAMDGVQEPAWFAAYPPGVAKTIDADAYPSVHAM